MSTFVPFSYRALVRKINWKKQALDTKIYDGDSVWLLFDKGRHQYENANCRLNGVNTPERNDTDPAVREKANTAREFLISNLEGKEVFVRSDKLDKYGRPLVTIWLDEEGFGAWHTLLAVGELRDRLRDELDDAFSRICLHKIYEEGLDVATDIMEEFFAEELVKIITQTVLMLNNDLSKLEKSMLAELDAFQIRREHREKYNKVGEDQIDSVVEKAQELIKKAGHGN
jgi:hypothetical protein